MFSSSTIIENEILLQALNLVLSCFSIAFRPLAKASYGIACANRSPVKSPGVTGAIAPIPGHPTSVTNT